MKTKNVTSHLFVSLIAISSLAGAFIFSHTPTVSAAASPGCYTKVTGGYDSAGSDCTGEKNYNSTLCYFNNPGQTTFTVIDCGQVTVVPTKSVGLNTGPAYGGKETCGSGDQAVHLSISIGCNGRSANPIFDALYALLRFLSIGVGVVLIGSTVVIGIQYSFARGDPSATASAKTHLLYIMIALLMYVFSFAILNYLVPGGLLG